MQQSTTSSAPHPHWTLAMHLKMLSCQCTQESSHLQCSLEWSFHSSWKIAPCLLLRWDFISSSCKPVTPQKRQLEWSSVGLQVSAWQEKVLGGTTFFVAGEERRLTTPCSVAKCILRESRFCRSRGDLHARHLKALLGSDRIIWKSQSCRKEV